MQGNVILHHHHHHHSGSSSNNKQPLTKETKYHLHYERENHLQQKRLLLSDFNDKKFESLHLRKLMQKLGAVYEDDLNIQPSDYFEASNNDALISDDGNSDSSAEEMDLISNNEFTHGTEHRYSAHNVRHSSHMTHIGGCPSGLGIEDGHTIADKTRHYKLCQPVHRLPVCKYVFFNEYIIIIYIN